MNFLLSDEQQALLETVRTFALNKGDAGARRLALDDEDGFDRDFWSELMDLGAGGVTLPEEFGGLGLELIDLALICEALGYASAPGPFLGHALAGIAINLAGSEEQKHRWLPALAIGDMLATVALGEEQGRWSPDTWQASLGGGVLAGDKPSVLYPAVADLIVVGLAGGELCVVETGASPIEPIARDAVDRTRRHWRLPLDGVKADVLPGGKMAGRLVDAALVLLASDAFGGASKALDMAVGFAKEREQFGQPIGSFQAVKHQLANMATAVEPVRGLYWYAAHSWDHVPEESSRVASIAKAHAADRFLQIARDMIEVHGGIGYTWEYDAHIWLKRAMFDYATLGTPAAHRSRGADLAGW